MNTNQERKKDTDVSKLKITDCFVNAMFLPKEYHKLLQLRTGKTILYLLILFLLASFVQYAIPVLGAIAGMGGIREIAMYELPQFSLDKGKLWVEEPYEVKDEVSGVYIRLDTDVEAFDKEDAPTDMLESVLISSSNMLVYSSMGTMGGIAQESGFDELKDITFNNELLAEMAPFLYGMIFSIYLIALVMMVIKYLIASLLYAVVMYMLAKTMMVDITFGGMYKTALFAGTMGTFVTAVTYCIGNGMLIMAGSAFAMLVTMMIMNRTIIQKKMEQSANQ